MLPGDTWRPDSHRPAAVRREMFQVTAHQRSWGCQEGSLQEYRVIRVRRVPVRPGQRGDVFLELQDSKKGILPSSCYAKPWSCQNLPVFQLNTVVKRKPQPTRQEHINEATRWPKRREEARHKDVCIQHPDRSLSHAVLFFSVPVVRL